MQQTKEKKQTVSEILAEFMEKFGKQLNQEERRTGDELFMWLKPELTQFEADIRKDERLRIAAKIYGLDKGTGDYGELSKYDGYTQQEKKV